MNNIAPLLTVDNVILDSDANSRKRAFEEASLLIEKSAGVSHQTIFDALIAREKLGSTCLGAGVAIPHGRVEGIEELTLAVVRCKQPIDFDTPDNRRARLLMVVAIPEADNEKYLDLLRDIVLMLKDRTYKDKLLNAQTPIELCQIIGAWQAPDDDAEQTSEQN